MPSTSAARRPMLGLSLCFCLLLGCAAGVEEEKTQQQRTTPYGRVGPPTLPPGLMPGGEEKGSKLPTITKNGDCYYDLAGVNETHLEILRVGSLVQGVTATSRLCSVQSLVLGTSVFLDEDLFTHCPLTSLTLKGKNWRCLQEGRMVQRRPDLVVDVENASCTDAWQTKTPITEKYSMREGVHKFQEFGITGCLIEQCACKWYFLNNAFNMSMDCKGRGLTDAALAKMRMLPSHVIRINFSRNNLSSMDTLIEYLKPNHEELEVLHIDNNQMTVLPRLGASFPRIVEISLINNAIGKIDFEDLEDLVSRKNLILYLAGNPFRCDEDMYRLKLIVHRLCKQSYCHCQHYMKDLKCRSEPSGELVPLYKVSGEDPNSNVDWWLLLNITLGLLNLIILYLMIDLIIILANKEGTCMRRPKMDFVVCWLKTVLCWFCPGTSARGDKDD